ncbi:transcriptional regulator TbsP domain-containing protein [Haloparvum sedimenti]|uniref:transcriptional regulator TbsP domain-containing protein n=1 Tax=Haloparvum sedimenti TaxID=1678448 RepID=UPI00071E7FBD|nr:DUF5821 family protein [Haloparvum sedimenti]
MADGGTPHATHTFEETLSAAPDGDPLLAVCRQYPTLRDVITTTHDAGVDTGPDLRVVAPKSVLHELKREFGTAWLAGDLVDTGRLSFHETTAELPTSVFATDTRVDNPIPLGDRVASTTAADETLANEVHTTYWEDLDTTDYALPFAGRERLLETFATECDETVAEAFATGVEANGERGSPLTVGAVVILAGAHGEVLHYDVGHWAEYQGVRSKASLSRIKQDLEDADLVTTSKVQRDVGRPRQRLHRGEAVADADMTTLVERAVDALD